MAEKHSFKDAVVKGNVQNVRGQFVKHADITVEDRYEMSANKGNQSVSATRYEVEAEGVKLLLPSVQAILQRPPVYAHVEKYTERQLAMANRMAITKDAEYGMIMYNNRPELGPVGVVFCDNYKSVIDDRYHSTLLKVAAMRKRYQSQGDW